MGPLSYPLSGPIYIDANILIYSIELVPPHAARLDAFWQHTSSQRAIVLTSELTALESLVGPLKSGNQSIETLYRQLLFSSANLTLLPITRAVLERAARLRAQLPALKTPDAIHAATALEESVATFLTNDSVFRQVPGLKVVAPRDLPTP
ncbi:MAG TPA: PIN domain-containing protein [Ktedonobacterales bacterium]